MLDLTGLDLRIAFERDSWDYISEEDEAEHPTSADQDDDDHMIDIYKDLDLYLAAKNGNREAFSCDLDRVSATDQASIADILRRLSPAGNTFLHVAAKHGNEAIVTYIAVEDSSLVLCKNSNGETALHLAAKGGHESTVRALVEIHKKQVHVFSSNEADRDNLFRAEDETGNTALHAALINGRESVAEYLIQEDPEAPYYQNKRGESALYLAAKAGSVKCIALILRHSRDQERIKKLFKEKSPIEAAIMEKNTDVLEPMLSRNPTLFQLRDGKGRTPLHYAASSGDLEVVLYLLDKCHLSATRRDKDGSLPIHVASIYGHVDIIHNLLERFPDPEEMLNRDGCNILHLAAANGRSNVVRYILNNSALAHLINMKDKKGNVPLHLAASQWHPKIVSLLAWDKRVNVRLVNNKGMTARDAALCGMSYNPDFRQRFTWAALKSAGVPRSLSRKTVGGQIPKKSRIMENYKERVNTVDGRTSRKSFNMENYKERVNTLLLVSTLVATITFAAGFTVPGGYNSSDTDLGIATMLRHKGFHVFIFCDTIAMYSSVIVAAALIWAQLGDLILVLNAFKLTQPLLGVALCTMSIAFTAAIFLTVSKLRWLRNAVLVMGITFLTILFVIVLPLGSPFTPRNKILRLIGYYPFFWLVSLTRSS